MPRPTPKHWKRLGTEGADISEICPDEFFEGLISKHFGSMSDELKIETKRRLKGVLEILQLGLAYKNRPTGAERRAALGDLAAKLSAARDALLRLDSDSLRLMEEASAKDLAFRGHIEPTLHVVKVDGQQYELKHSYGEDHIAAVVEYIDAARGWVESASEASPNSKAGKTDQPDQARAVRRLLDIWRASRGDRRTLTDDLPEEKLQALAADALTPVLQIFGKAGPLTGHVHQALFGADLRPGEE